MRAAHTRLDDEFINEDEVGNILSYEYNEDLVGFILTLKDGSVVQTQFEKEENRLHADFNTYSLRRYNEYDTRATSKAEDLEIEYFMQNNKEVLDMEKKIWWDTKLETMKILDI